MFALKGRNVLRVAVVIVCLAVAATASAMLLASSVQQRRSVATALTNGDETRAPVALRRYGCGGCHTIPGIPGADGLVGGRLVDLRERVYIAGVVRNEPANLVQWIVDPPSLNPRTAMPVTGISAAEARDVAAYLYAH